MLLSGKGCQLPAVADTKDRVTNIVRSNMYGTVVIRLYLFQTIMFNILARSRVPTASIGFTVSDARSLACLKACLEQASCSLYAYQLPCAPADPSLRDVPHQPLVLKRENFHVDLRRGVCWPVCGEQAA